jgi:hypothetical protein
MAFECLHTEELLTATLAGRATEAERLLLEEHLERCAACREQRAACEALRRTRAWEPELSDVARERVLRGLLAAATAPAGRHAATAPWGGWSTVAIAAAFALAIVGLFVPAWRKAAVPQAMAAGDPVAAANAHDRLRPGADGKVTIDGAVVAVTAGTEAFWRSRSRVVELRRGALVVEAGPAAGPLRLATPDFSLRAVDATLRLDLRGVSTERGVVKILTHDDQPITEVKAGHRWRMGEGTHPLSGGPR